MPISKKEFDDETFKAYRGSSLKILDFLKENKDSAYTSKEISEGIEPKVSQVSATIALRNLIKSNLVDYKKPYYMIKTGSSSSSRKKPATKKEEEGSEDETNEDDNSEQ